MIFNSIEKELRDFNLISSYCKNKSSWIYQATSEKQYKNNTFGLADIGSKKHVGSKPINFYSHKSTQIIKNLCPKYSENTKKLTNTWKIKQTNKIQNDTKKYVPKKYLSQFDKVRQNDIEQILCNQPKHVQLNSMQIVNSYLKISYSIKQRANQISLSQTSISIGSQLYELSPIHFQKYMQYQQRQKINNNFQYRSNRKETHQINQQKQPILQQKTIQTKQQTDPHHQIAAQQKNQDTQSSKATKTIKQDKFQITWICIILLSSLMILIYQIIR